MNKTDQELFRFQAECYGDEAEKLKEIDEFRNNYFPVTRGRFMLVLWDEFVKSKKFKRLKQK